MIFTREVLVEEETATKLEMRELHSTRQVHIQEEGEGQLKYRKREKEVNSAPKEVASKVGTQIERHEDRQERK